MMINGKENDKIKMRYMLWERIIISKYAGKVWCNQCKIIRRLRQFVREYYVNISLCFCL